MEKRDVDYNNPTLVLMRRLLDDKREAKREMREMYKTNPDVRRAIEELDRRRAEKNA